MIMTMEMMMIMMIITIMIMIILTIIIIIIIVIRVLLLAERRNSLLRHSRLSVVAFLNELPQTKHELTSFTVDVNLALVSGCNHVFILKHVTLHFYYYVIQQNSFKHTIYVMSYMLAINISGLECPEIL